LTFVFFDIYHSLPGLRELLLCSQILVMEWYQYIAAFFSGVFFANMVPHFVQGISGNKFPTPFAKPPGKGLSSPTVNVVWALFNLLVGYVLFRASNMNSSNTLSIVIFFLGISAMSIMSSKTFQQKDKE